MVLNITKDRPENLDSKASQPTFLARVSPPPTIQYRAYIIKLSVWCAVSDHLV